MNNKIPKSVIEELKLKKPTKEITEKAKLIVENHQASIKIPSKMRNELSLETGSKSIYLTLNKKGELIVKGI